MRVDQRARLGLDHDGLFDDQIGTIAPDSLLQLEQLERYFSLDAESRVA